MSIQAPASARPAVATGVASAVESRLLPLVRVRAPLLRVRHQLHRSPGHRHSQADAAAAVRVERARLRRHRVFVSARLRDRLPVRRPADGPARHADRVFDRDCRVERRGDGACVGAVLRRRGRGDTRDVRPHLQRLGCRASWARVSRWGLEKPAISPAPSRRSPNGSRARSARSRPASSTRARTSAPC